MQTHRHRRQAVISVIDQGVGIPAGDLPRIFEKFYRGEKASEQKAAGSGMGLYIARGIVEAAGGKIHIESTEGKGTTISVSLPLKLRWYRF